MISCLKSTFSTLRTLNSSKFICRRILTHMPPKSTSSSLVGGILDGDATGQLVTVAAAFVTGDGLVVDKNELCVNHEDYRYGAGSQFTGSPLGSLEGSDLSGGGTGGMEKAAAAAARVNDALLTTQQARSASIMMRTALRMHDPQSFIDHENRRAASEDTCPMDRGVGTQIPFTQMNVVVLPSNENGFCLTGSDDLPYLLSILNDSHAEVGSPTGTRAPAPPTPTAAPTITIHTSARKIQCDALLLDAVSSMTSTSPVTDASGKDRKSVV